MNRSLQNYFSELGGMHFGMMGANLLYYDRTKEDEYIYSVFLWLLISEAISRADNSETILDWMNDQLDQLGSDHKQTAFFLREQAREKWAAWLPILLMSKEDEKDTVWAEFQDVFPPINNEQPAIRELIFTLLQRYRKKLFTSGDWLEEITNPERYTTPDSCATVKLGLTLAKLEKDGLPENRSLFGQWREILKAEVLRKLPSRIQPGFAPSSPSFESLVLAILTTADWLVQPGHQRVTEMLDESVKSAGERLDPNQLCLAGALYGWAKGYRTAGGWISNQAQRRFLSELALRLAIHRSPEDWKVNGVDPVIFYSSYDGTRYRFCQSFAQIKKIEVTKEYQPSSKKRRLEPVKECVRVGFAGGSLAVDLNFEGTKIPAPMK